MAKQMIRVTVNGEPHELAVEPGASLLQVLRGELALVSRKRGCDTGGCGCCTVEVDGQVVYSCMRYALSLDGAEVVTIEGLAQNGQSHPIQAAFVDAGAVQCGYCTCGMMMSARALLQERPPPDEEEIRHGIAGNACRCTGYQKIVDAIRLAADAS